MSNTMKSTLKSVAALTAVAVVCVALLAVANAFIPKYKPTLDAATAALINKISPTGVGDADAYIGGYFEMYALDKKELADFNKANGEESNNKVLAVYSIVKGNHKGTYAVEAQAQGYSGNEPIIMLTSFHANGTVMSTTVKSQNENSPGQASIFDEDYFKKLVDYVAGKNLMSSDEIITSTGATTKYSVNGVVNAINISHKMVASLGTELPPPSPSSPVTDAALLAKLTALSQKGSTVFESYVVPAEYSERVAALYKGNKGDILITGKSTGWGAMEILFAFNNSAVANLTIVKNNEYIGGTPSAGIYEFNDASVKAALVNKTLTQVKAMSMDDLLANTGATVQRTANGIRGCAEGALEFYAAAPDYIDSLSAVSEGGR